MNEIKLPFLIPKEMISLPTKGGEVQTCRLFHKGEPDPSEFGKKYNLIFQADTVRYEGVIYSVDRDAMDIHFEAGLPLKWNQKAVQQGGGGINGYVPPCSMPLHGQCRKEKSALEQGYLVFGSDSGHVFPNGNPYDCSWVMNQECFENYAYLSLKKTKDAVMFLAENVYGKKPEKVYFYGGSNGGRECIKAIENYSQDYDGAICFFPVLYWTLKIIKDGEDGAKFDLLGQEKWFSKEQYKRLLQLEQEVYQEYDEITEGEEILTKAVLPDKKKIKEYIRLHVTKEQMKMLKILDSSRKFPYPLAYGDTELPGYPAFEGADLYGTFAMRAEAHKEGYLSIGDSMVGALYAHDQKMNTRNFDVVEWKENIQKISRWMDAYGADLTSFVQKNGKLLLVQGSMDPQVTAQGTVQFYKYLKSQFGKEKLKDFLRFYMIPGYGHGTGGPCEVDGDFLGVLDNWVENGKGPEEKSFIKRTWNK